MNGRIIVLWRYCSKVYGPTAVKTLSNWKKKKVDHVKVGGRRDEAMQNLAQRKRKRKWVIEDSYDDPHIYRISCTYILKCLSCVFV